MCCTQVANFLRCICVLYTSRSLLTLYMCVVHKSLTSYVVRVCCTVANTTDDKKKEMDRTLE